jgi:hypothetical protein
VLPPTKFVFSYKRDCRTRVTSRLPYPRLFRQEAMRLQAMEAGVSGGPLLNTLKAVVSSDDDTQGGTDDDLS